MSALSQYRAQARLALEPVLSGGGCFVRVAQAGPLLVTDALRRAPDPALILQALMAAGFHPSPAPEGLLSIGLPDAAYAIPDGSVPGPGDWDAQAFARQALCRQLLCLKAPPGPVEPEGRPLVDAALRALDRARDRAKAPAGVAAQAAVAHRRGARRALYLCGLYLAMDLAEGGIGVPEGTYAYGQF